MRRIPVSVVVGRLLEGGGAFGGKSLLHRPGRVRRKRRALSVDGQMRHQSIAHPAHETLCGFFGDS